MKTLQRSDFLYQAFYCEENIWHLCQHPSLINSKVIFIASKSEAFPMLCQRAMNDPATPILWDYHVVLLTNRYADHTTHQILDFDTTLSFCSPIDAYLHQSFMDSRLLTPEYTPHFRVVSAADYIQYFHSDRSHMKTASGGWNAPPPVWPVIGNGSSNLARFIDMDDTQFGKVYSLEALLERFSG